MRRKLPPYMTKQAYRAGWRTYYFYQAGKGKSRVKIPLGSDYDEALRGYHREDQRRLAGRDLRAGRITLEDWIRRYLRLVGKKRSLGRDERSCKKLLAFFGDVPLTDITRSRIMEYRLKREESVKSSTCNRELACLRHMLNLAAGEVIDSVPKIKMESEAEFARERTIAPEEYDRLLKTAARHLRPILICLWETGMRSREALFLTWDKVDLGARVIRLKASDTKEKRPKTVPITDGLYLVFAVLKDEKVANLANRVFARRGRPLKDIRTAWERTRTGAGLNELWLHDFRHTAITRMEAEGIPPGAIMAATGHRTFRQHQKYTNFKEDQIREAFGIEKNLRKKQPSVRSRGL